MLHLREHGRRTIRVDGIDDMGHMTTTTLLETIVFQQLDLSFGEGTEEGGSFAAVGGEDDGREDT